MIRNKLQTFRKFWLNVIFFFENLTKHFSNIMTVIEIFRKLVMKWRFFEKFIKSEILS